MSNMDKRGGGDRRTASLLRIIFCIILIVVSVLLSIHEGKSGEKQKEKEEKVTAKIAPSASPETFSENTPPTGEETGQESELSAADASPVPEQEMSAETYGRASTVIIQNGECLDTALDVHGNSILGTRIREFLNGFDRFATVNMVQIDAKTLYAGEALVSFYADMYEGESREERLFCSYDFSDFIFAIEKQEP